MTKQAILETLPPQNGWGWGIRIGFEPGDSRIPTYIQAIKDILGKRVICTRGTSLLVFQEETLVYEWRFRKSPNNQKWPELEDLVARIEAEVQQTMMVRELARAGAS